MSTYNFSNNANDSGEGYVSGKDDVKGVLIPVILGIAFIIMGLAAFFLGLETQKKDNDFMEHSTYVIAEITDVYSKHGSGDEGTRYYFMLKYTYSDVEYEQRSSYITEKELSSAGYSKNDVIGRTIKVYIDKRNPSSVRLKKPQKGFGLYLVLIFPLIGVILLLWAIKFGSDIKKGKYMVYKRPGHVFYKKI